MINFTPEDLLEYYYQETSPEQTAAIENALSQSWSLSDKYQVIVQAAKRLDKSMESPRTEVLQRILNYAASTTPAVSE